jgi:hypothetical protein
VGTLVDTPDGKKDGRPGKAMTLDQAMNGSGWLANRPDHI